MNAEAICNEIHEVAGHRTLAKQLLNVPASMFADAALEVVRYTDVDDSFASIHEDVDPVLV